MAMQWTRLGPADDIILSSCQLLSLDKSGDYFRRLYVLIFPAPLGSKTLPALDSQI